MNLITTIESIGSFFAFVSNVLNNPHSIAIALLIAVICGLIVWFATQKVTIAKLTGIAMFFVAILW